MCQTVNISLLAKLKSVIIWNKCKKENAGKYAYLKYIILLREKKFLKRNILCVDIRSNFNKIFFSFREDHVTGAMCSYLRLGVWGIVSPTKMRLILFQNGWHSFDKPQYHKNIKIVIDRKL